MLQKYILLISTILSASLVNAQKHNLPTSKYLNEEVNAIGVNSYYSNGDWTDVLKKVENKRIVLLGELNHGSKEIFLSRNDLIKSLHKEMGFNIILFESGIGELISINEQKHKLTPTEMTYGFFSGWRTDEFTKLMDYVKSNNISISGFDVQRTGSSFEKTLVNELERLNLSSNEFSDLEKRFSDEKGKLTNRKTTFNSVQKSTNELVKSYQALEELIKKVRTQDLNETSYFVIKTIENRIKYLEYFLDFVNDKDYRKRWKARDFMMYSNIDWLLNTIYKNDKVIVIGHNFHIAKYNEKEEVMGEFLKKKYDSEMYSIGVFAGNGSFSNNIGSEETLKPISNESLDIKYIINKLNCRVGFIDIPRNDNKNSEWLYSDIIVNDTFIDLNSSNKMNLSEHFDGLIFIDKISPPDKN